jgi:hypothetical protein
MLRLNPGLPPGGWPNFPRRMLSFCGCRTLRIVKGAGFDFPSELECRAQVGTRLFFSRVPFLSELPAPSFHVSVHLRRQQSDSEPHQEKHYTEST